MLQIGCKGNVVALKNLQVGLFLRCDCMVRLPVTFCWVWMFAWSSWEDTTNCWSMLKYVEVYRCANVKTCGKAGRLGNPAYAQTMAHYDCLGETMFGTHGSQSSLTIPTWLTGGHLKEHTRNQISELEPFNLALFACMHTHIYIYIYVYQSIHLSI